MTVTRTFANDVLTSTAIRVMTCAGCGLTFGLNDEFIAARREDRRSWYCPNGHSQWFPGRTDAEVAREQQERADLAERQLKYARTRATHEADQRRAAELSNRALKGVVTKTRKRAAAGVCPCCNRTFQALQRHVATQHPEFAAEHLGQTDG